MKVLVLNSGSSSLKTELYAMPEGDVLANGAAQRIGEEEAEIELKAGSAQVKRAAWHEKTRPLRAGFGR